MNSIMSCYLNSNVLVYLSNKDSVGYVDARNILLNLIEMESSILVSSLVWDEFLYSIRSLVNTSISDEISKLLRIQYFKTITVSMDVKKVMSIMEEYGLRPRDAFHFVTAVENKVEYFATFDNDFTEVFKNGKLKKFELPFVQSGN